MGSVSKFDFCEPCAINGGQKPNLKGLKPIMVKSASIGKFDAKLKEVKLNGKVIDLAYIFVRKNVSENFKNLAKAAGCKTSQVSAELKGTGMSY